LVLDWREFGGNSWTTDALGKYTLNNITEGTYILVIKSRDEKEDITSTPFTIAGRGDVEVNIPLP